MKITFLGTGTSQGVPVILCDCKVCKSTNANDKRLRTSIAIETNGITIVIDAGPDFRQQILRSEIRNINAILFTHNHKDHTAGLDDVRPFNFFYKKSMEIYAEEAVRASLHNEYAYIFAEKKYPGTPKVNVNVIGNDIFYVENIKITPIRVMHGRLPILGYRIKDVSYITDASHIEDEELAKIVGSKILVINALRKKRHYSHFTLNEALDIIKKVKPERAFITHISHLMGLHDEVAKELPDNVQLAHDNLTIKI